jgi:hypothetical protein
MTRIKTFNRRPVAIPDHHTHVRGRLTVRRSVLRTTACGRRRSGKAAPRRVHALRPSGVVTQADWPALDVAVAAEQSSLPPHLIAQIDDYLAGLGSFACVFVHADLIGRHE